MLKITPLRMTQDELVLGLEGKLIGAWVDELRGAVSNSSVKARNIQFDLSRVSYVDSTGQQLLKDLVHQGVVMHRATPFVKEMLREELS